MVKKTTKTPLTEEQKQRRRVGRSIGLACFNAQFKADHPEAGKEERKAAWKEARKAQTRIGMRALKQLEQAGFTITPPPVTAKETAPVAAE